LSAYGQLLVQRHRIAMCLQAALEPEQPVWSTEAFALFPVERPDPRGREITASQLEHPHAIPLMERVAAVKALATVLRFAYLADAPVRRIGLIVSRRVTTGPRRGSRPCSATASSSSCASPVSSTAR
jgi:hypothetical protein